MIHVSEGIYEAAWLTINNGGRFFSDADPEENAAEWIRVFAAEVNRQLPDGVELDIERCKQAGNPDAFVSEDEFIKILGAAECKTDKAAICSRRKGVKNGRIL